MLGRCVTKESPADDGSFLAPRWHFSIYGARWLNDRNCAKPVNSALTRERLQSPQCGCQKLPESNVPIEEGAMLQDLAPARHSRHFLVQIESYASCASIRNLRTFVVTLSFEGTLF